MSYTQQPEVLKLLEAAKLLQVSEKTLWQEAKAGKIPHFRVGKQFRFIRTELLEWARSKNSPGGSSK